MAGMRKLRGKWYIRVFLPGGKEKLLPTKTGDRKLAEAKKRLIEEREFLVKARLVEDMHQTVVALGEAIDEYLADCRSRLRKTTVENYELALKNLRNCWGDIGLRQITIADYTKLRNYLSSRVGATATNIRLAAIRTFLNWLVLSGKLDRLPGKMLLIKVDEQLPKFFSPPELESIMARVKHPQMKAIFKVLAATGMRRGEIFNCTLEDNYLHLRETKGRRDRLVALPQELIPDFLLATRSTIALVSISRAFCQEIRDAGIESKGRSLHSLRHTFALREYYRTGDIYYVKGLLGHSAVATTERYLKFPDGYLEGIFGKWVPRYSAQSRLTQRPEFQA